MTVINLTKNSSQAKESKAHPHNIMQEDIASLHTFLQFIQSTVTTIKNLQESHQNEVMVLSNLSVPALRNLETIPADMQVNQNKISQNFGNAATFSGSYEKSISSLREEIQSVVALKGNEVSASKLYDMLCKKHSKIESVQDSCIDNMDKYMNEIAKLNQTIQEKDNLILDLKLEISQLKHMSNSAMMQTKNESSQNRLISVAESHPSYAYVAKQDTKRDNPMIDKHIIQTQTNKLSTEIKQNETPQTDKQHTSAISSKQNFTAFGGE